jgi:hypothetical protein
VAGARAGCPNLKSPFCRRDELYESPIIRETEESLGLAQLVLPKPGFGQHSWPKEKSLNFSIQAFQRGKICV